MLALLAIATIATIAAVSKENKTTENASKDDPLATSHAKGYVRGRNLRYYN